MMATGLHPKTGLFEQFAGYFALEEIRSGRLRGPVVCQWTWCLGGSGRNVSR